VLVHSSLSSFGHVKGGSDAVIDALLEAVGVNGTVLVPTLTGSEELSPQNPPRFDPATSDSWTGRIPETFRKRAEAVRSMHPTHSAAAIGADAGELTREHVFSITPCDELSPYGKVAQSDDGYVLLLGVDHESNTTFHHIEEIAGVDYHMQRGFAEATTVVNGAEVQRNYMLHQYGTPRDFNVMEPIFIERGVQQTARIGECRASLIRAREMVRATLQCLRADPRTLCRD
jgi:aminoglycoside 3-N-acetyltransferase